MNVLHEYVFFSDRDLGRQVPEILRAAGLRVEVHDDHFSGHDPPTDVEWLQYIGPRGWIALTHDKSIRHTSRERDQIMESRVRAFVLRGKRRNRILGENFVRTSHKVARFLRENGDPFIANIYCNANNLEAAGTVKMWLSYKQWKLIGEA